MANWYVWSGATGGGTGVDWANAYITLQAAMTAKAAGDTFFVAHDHAQSQSAALTITPKGTSVSMNRIYCVNRAGAVPPGPADLTTGASITVTGTGGITLVGNVAECNGLSFISGGNIWFSSAQLVAWRLTNCKLRISGTTAASRIFVPDFQQSICTIENTTMQFGAVGQGVALSGNGTVWRNTPNALVGPTYPAILFRCNNYCSSMLIEGVDLSALPSANTYCETGVVYSAPIGNTRVTMKDCKLSTAAIMAANTAAQANPEAILIRCDSGDTNYRTERYNAMGVMSTETTVVLTGGTTDGTTPISWKFATSAAAMWEWPLEGFPISVWNETVGSPVTVTMQGIWGGGAVPNNDDIYFDCEYPGTSGFPLGVKATSTKATPLTASAPLAAGVGTWGGSTFKFQMSATFTPLKKGPFTITVKAAKPSSIFFVDPTPVIT